MMFKAELSICTHMDEQRELSHQTTQLLQILKEKKYTFYYDAYGTNLLLQEVKAVSVSTMN